MTQPEIQLRRSILQYLGSHTSTLTTADKDALIRSNGIILSSLIMYSFLYGGAAYYIGRLTPLRRLAPFFGLGGAYVGYRISGKTSFQKSLEPFLTTPTEFGDFVRHQAKEMLPPDHRIHKLYEGISYQQSSATAQTVTKAPRGSDQIEYMKNTGYINYANAKPADNKNDEYYFDTASPIDSQYKSRSELELEKDDSRFRTDVSSIKLNNLDSNLQAVEEARRVRLQSARNIKPKRKEANNGVYDEQLEFGRDDY